MSLRNFTFSAALFAGLTIQLAPAQDQPIYLRSICTKAEPGKGPEIEELLGKNAIKVAQYNISQGRLARFVVLRNTYPAGSSAECDYISSFFYNGPPPESNQPAEWAAAKVGMTYEAFLAKLRSLSHTVRVEIYVARARVGSSQVGDYVAINRMKVHDFAAWSELETKIWKPLQEARVKDGQLRAWSSYSRVLPSGDAQPYHAMTADIFPSWDVMWKQKPLGGYIKQAVPDMSREEFNSKTSKARDLVSKELFKIVMATGSISR